MIFINRSRYKYLRKMIISDFLFQNQYNPVSWNTGHDGWRSVHEPWRMQHAHNKQDAHRTHPDTRNATRGTHTHNAYQRGARARHGAICKRRAARGRHTPHEARDAAPLRTALDKQ